MRYLIERESRLRFEQPVREHQLQLRVAPWDSDRQQVRGCSLTSEPSAEPASHRDCFGNRVYRLGVVSAHERLITRLRAEVETRPAESMAFEAIAPDRERSWIDHSLHQAPRLLDFLLHRSTRTPILPENARDGVPFPAFDPRGALLTQVHHAMIWVGETFQRNGGGSEPADSLGDLLTSGRGGPGDLAHLLVALVRGWGVPARYATGYLDPMHLSTGDEDEDRPQTMHAWAEVLIPGAGWCGFDPSLGLIADETYIGVAVGRDAADVQPERAACKGDATEPEATVSLSVMRMQ